MQSVMEKPSLPSIKYILGDADPLLDQHHRSLPPPPQPTHSAFFILFVLCIFKKVAGD
jgi:hypothetical protein